MRVSLPDVSLATVLRSILETFRPPHVTDPRFEGEWLASVSFSQDLLSDSGLDIRGTLVLYRAPSGRVRIGIEMPHPEWGGLWSPVRRVSYSLDDVLEVRWKPGRWGGELVLTSVARDGFSALPGRARNRFAVTIGRADRERADAFAYAVALEDLPD